MTLKGHESTSKFINGFDYRNSWRIDQTEITGPKGIVIYMQKVFHPIMLPEGSDITSCRASVRLDEAELHDRLDAYIRGWETGTRAMKEDVSAVESPEVPGLEGLESPGYLSNKNQKY